MNDFSNLFGYRPGDSPIHRIPAHIKLAALLPCTAAVFALGIPALAGLTVVMLVLSLAAGITFPVFLRNTRIILIYGILVALFRFTGKPLNGEPWLAEAAESALYLWRLFLVMLTGTLFYETTSTLEIRHALADFQEWVSALLSRAVKLTGIKVKSPELPDIAFLLSLTFTFIPRIFATQALLEDAWDARSGKAHRNPVAAIRRVTVLIPLLVSKLLALAADTERAIRNRSV